MIGALSEQEVSIPAGSILLEGNLVLPRSCRAVVIFGHGSGSSRHSPRNRFVAGILQEAGIGTLLFDLLSAGEDAVYANRFLVLPDGLAPETVRKEPKAVELVRDFFMTGKAVAAICHGPQILITAGLLKGRRATCYRTVAVELKAAGALYEDKEVVVDGNLITSRRPSDLPAFMRETMKMIHSAAYKAKAA